MVLDLLQHAIHRVLLPLHGFDWDVGRDGAPPRPLIEVEDTFRRAGVAGTAAGFTSGLFAAAIGFVFGTLIETKLTHAPISHQSRLN